MNPTSWIAHDEVTATDRVVPARTFQGFHPESRPFPGFPMKHRGLFSLARVGIAFLYFFKQAIKKWKLGFLQFAAGLQYRDETDLVDFWKTFELSGINGPFHAESVALMDVTLRQIVLASPGLHDFAPLLLNCPEVDEGSRRMETDLLEKLSLRCFGKAFALVRDAFRDGPVAFIFRAEERT